jgi:transcriptional regulator with XRE-family HTH domain
VQSKKLTLVDFSSRLRDLAENKGKRVSQKTLAELCDVSPAAVSKWFSGGHVKSEYAVKLSEFFGVSVEYLLGLDSESRIARAAEYAKEHGGTDAALEEGVIKYQAQDFHQLYLAQKSRADRLEKQLVNLKKGLVKLVEQIGREE